MKNVLIACLMLILSVYSAKLPEYLKKCKKASDNHDCFISNGQAVIETLTKNVGEPKFKLQGLTPIHVPKIDLQATPHLKVILNEVDFYGYDKLKLKNGSIDGEMLYFAAQLPRVELVGKYDIDGRILILPIQGQGTFNITTVDAEINYATKLLVDERKARKYFRLADDSTTLKIEKVKRVYWHFDNLFNGDERLGPEMNKFLNENWEDVFGEVQLAMEKTIAFSIMNYFVSGYLHYIPIDDLFDEVK